MNQKIVFVTGGSGFVGQNLIPMLIKNGYIVKALARSDKVIQLVEKLGALAIKGDINDKESLEKGIEDCSSVFHLAASVDFFASEMELKKIHVDATKLLLNVAQKANVHKFIYLGAASVIMNGKPISNVDENFISDNIIDGYSRTKLEAEKLVLNANCTHFKTISLRPPLIWGKGDPNTLPKIIEAINKGKMMFINGGSHRFVTCHVTNVCHGLLLAEKSEIGGNAYFLTDGETPVFKEFIKKYVATKGIQVPDKNVPLIIARVVASLMEFIWKCFNLNGTPPLYYGLINTLGLEFITIDQKARKELGYKSIINIQEGINQMME